MTPPESSPIMCGRLARFARLIALPLGLLAGGCSTSSQPLGFTEWSELMSAQQRWKARGFANYSFEMRVDCFCDRDATDWAIVDVRDGHITRVRQLSGADVPQNQWVWRRTIDELFRIVATEDASWIDHVAMEFDPALGFPLTITLTAKANILDAGAAYRARNVQPLD